MESKEIFSKNINKWDIFINKKTKINLTRDFEEDNMARINDIENKAGSKSRKSIKRIRSSNLMVDLKQQLKVNKSNIMGEDVS